MSLPISSEELYKEARAFQTKKRLGQNFLVDADVLELIASILAFKPGEKVVEIGPGIGFLTRILSENGALVSAVDLDRSCIEALDELQLSNVATRHGDFLGYNLINDDFSKIEDLSQENISAFPRASLKVIGNVPYQITGLILSHLLGEIGEPSPWLFGLDRIVLTVQREVALRMVAEAGTEHYSQVSLLIGYYCKAELISMVPPTSFYPRPAVTSAIVRLVPHPKTPVDCANSKLLRKVIKAGFAQRRKMLRNALASMSLPSVDIDSIFKEERMDPQARAENLSLQQFAILTNAIENKLKLHRP